MRKPIEIDISVWLPMAEIQRLKPPQCHALLSGIAQVVAAFPRLPDEPEPSAVLPVDPPPPHQETE